MADKQYPDVWLFDENRRVYTKPAPGREWGEIIWREHWRKLTIVGETRVSWISSHGDRIPKKGGRGYAFSQEDIDRQAWMKDNRYKFVRMIEHTTDYDLLRRVADLIGYKSVEVTSDEA